MPDYVMRSAVGKVAAEGAAGAKAANENWFAEHIDIVGSEGHFGSMRISFYFDTPSVIEYTVDADAGTPVWMALEDNEQIQGYQSRSVDIKPGDRVNFRAAEAGSLARAVVAEF